MIGSNKQTGNSRSKMLFKNIALSALFKAVGLLCSLLIVPVTLDYLDNEIYGVWLTLTSILYWFTFFDVGLGNGMRNYLTQAISKGDYLSAKSCISTTLSLLLLISAVIATIVLIAVCLFDLTAVFNISAISDTELKKCVAIAVVFTFINFVVKNVGYIFIALQKYAVNDFLSISGSVLSLVAVFILTKTTESNLLYVVSAFTGIPVAVYILSSIPIFHKYPQFKPSWKAIDKAMGRKITSKGIGFFVIQITSCLVIFGSSNIFITQFESPSAVTTYNIAYKFFYLLAIAYTIVVSPMWNAYTDAFVKGDLQWIRATFRRSLAIWCCTVLAGAIMLCICSIFYRLWIGEAVIVPLAISASVLCYICMFNFNSGVTCLLNGLNKIRVQIITSVVVTAIYIVIVLLLGNRLKTVGIVLTMAAAYAIMGAIHLFQCFLLIRGKAHGIWNK